MSYSLKTFLMCLCGVLSLSSTAPQSAFQEEQPLDWKEELKAIDEEIQQAQDLQNRYLAAARRAEDEGMRWQFMQNQKQEAKRAFQRADEKKQAAQMLEARIALLKARKAQLLQQHPEANALAGAPFAPPPRQATQVKSSQTSILM